MGASIMCATTCASTNCCAIASTLHFRASPSRTTTIDSAESTRKYGDIAYSVQTLRTADKKCSRRALQSHAKRLTAMSDAVTRHCATAAQSASYAAAAVIQRSQQLCLLQHESKDCASHQTAYADKCNENALPSHSLFSDSLVLFRNTEPTSFP